MSTRNRPTRLTVESAHNNGGQGDAEEPNSETLPKVNTPAILDTYDQGGSVAVVRPRSTTQDR